MVKNILFLAHSNNDVDWFMPLISGLKESEGYEPMFFFLKTKEEVGISRAHERIMERLNIKEYSFYDLPGSSGFTKMLFRVSRYCAARSGLVPLKESLKNLDFYGSLLKIVYVGIDKLFKRLLGCLFPAERINRFIDEKSVAMTVIENQKIKKHPPYNDLRSYATSRIVSYCKAKSIPVFMMPHGVTAPVVLKSNERCSFYPSDSPDLHDENVYLFPDILGVNTESERGIHSILAGKSTKVVVLGAIRYDYAWSKKMRGISMDTLGTDLKKDRFVILYLPIPFAPYGLVELDQEVNDDVMSLVEGFPQVEFWIKNHPRYPRLFKSDNAVVSGSSPRVRVFGNETDTNALVFCSDLVIVPLSSVIFEAILGNKPVISYERWKEYMYFKSETVYEDLPCVFRASDRRELYDCCRRAIDGGKPDGYDIEEFYKTWISKGLGRNESIISGYVDVVRQYSK